MKLELTRREIDALSFALAEFDAIFWKITEDNPDYRKYELAWAELDRVSELLHK